MKPLHEHSAGITIQLSAQRAAGSLPGATHSLPQTQSTAARGHKTVPVLITNLHERYWEIKRSE